MLAGLVLAIGGVAAVPPDAVLGGTTRLVFFHGAVVWTAIINAAAATLLGLAILVRGAPLRATDLLDSGRAVRATPHAGWCLLWRLFSFATVFWVLTLALSFPVMQASWGGILWGETRLVMSFQVVFLYSAAWALSLLLLMERPLRWLAGVTAAVGAVTTFLVFTTPGTFHPDNPVFRSGDPRFIGGFLVILAGLVCFTVGGSLLRRLPRSAGLAPRAGIDAAA